MMPAGCTPKLELLSANKVLLSTSAPSEGGSCPCGQKDCSAVHASCQVGSIRQCTGGHMPPTAAAAASERHESIREMRS